MKAKAAISDSKGNFTIGDIEVNDPQTDEVLVKMMASGVCHTDHDSMSWGNPLVMGHEGAGIVEKVGPGVSHVAPGDKVLLNWATPCGKCFQCKRGAENICIDKKGTPLERTLYKGKGIARAFRIGTMSTLSVVSKEAVTKMEVDIPFTSACIIGCGVMTGFGSATNAAKVEKGSSVVVIGTGGVGLNVIQGAKVCGAKKIIAVDINAGRLKMAKEFGATDTILAGKDDKLLSKATEQVKKMTNDQGADYAFESTAVPALGAAPLAMCRNGGTAVQVSGIEQEITIDMSLFEWDKTYINPLYGQCRPSVDFPKILKLYADKQLKLDELVTRTYPLEELGQAFADMQHGKNAKGVLVLN